MFDENAYRFRSLVRFSDLGDAATTEDLEVFRDRLLSYACRCEAFEHTEAWIHGENLHVVYYFAETPEDAQFIVREFEDRVYNNGGF